MRLKSYCVFAAIGLMIVLAGCIGGRENSGDKDRLTTDISEPVNQSNVQNQNFNQSELENTSISSEGVVDEDKLSTLVTAAKLSQEDPLSCQYAVKLTAGKQSYVNASGILLKLEQAMEPSSGEGHVKINDGVILNLSYGEINQLEFLGKKKIKMSLQLVRDGNILLCIDTDETYDVALCSAKSGQDRFMCFDNLGYKNGIDYCSQILVDADRTACIGGATGGNG